MTPNRRTRIAAHAVNAMRRAVDCLLRGKADAAVTATDARGAASGRGRSRVALLASPDEARQGDLIPGFLVITAMSIVGMTFYLGHTPMT